MSYKPRADYVHGLVLFNRGEFFRAHEALEDAWRECRVENRQLVQGLVQVAAAMHHFSTGNAEGGRSVLARALRNLNDYPDQYGGVDLGRLRHNFESWTSGPSKEAFPALVWDTRMIKSDFP